MVSILAKKDLLEGLPEDLVEYGIKYWVHHGAGVAEPGDEVKNPLVDIPLTLCAEGGDHVEDKEGCP